MPEPPPQGTTPHTTPSLSKQKLMQAGNTGAYLLAALLVFAMFLHVSRFNGWRRVYFADMIYGRAWRPFVYRVLLPQTARLLVAPIPEATRTAIDDRLDSIPFIHRVTSTIGWEKEYLTEYIAAAGLMFLSLLGFGWALRYLFTGLFQSPPWLANIIPFIGILALPPLFTYTYIYDFSTLFLFTLGLAYLVRRKWSLYLIIFLAGCLNKETIILLTAIFIFYYLKDQNLGRKKFVQLLIAQLAIFAVIRLSLQWIFRNNQGSLLEFHLLDHNLPLLYNLVKPYSFLVLISIIVFGFVFFYHWPVQPRLLRISFCCVTPTLLLLTFLFGFLEEWRDYYEAYPIIILMLTFAICQLTHVNLTEKPAAVLVEQANS